MPSPAQEASGGVSTRPWGQPSRCECRLSAGGRLGRGTDPALGQPSTQPLTAAPCHTAPSASGHCASGLAKSGSISTIQQ